MAKPTPLRTASKSIIIAQGCIERILVGSNANGKYARIGTDTREDIEAVIQELKDIQNASSFLTESITNLIECMSPKEDLRLRADRIITRQNSAPVVFKDLPPIESPIEEVTETNSTSACTI